MTPDAISKTDTLDLMPDLRTTPSDADGGMTPATKVKLGGRYRFQARDVAAEIELIDATTQLRSLIYLKDGVDLYLTIPESTYRFYIRYLVLPKADAQLGFMRMGAVQTLAFYTQKAAALLFRPDRWMGVLRGAFGPKGAGIVASRLSSGVETLAPIPPRPALVLGDVDPKIVAAGVSIIIPTKERFDLLKACIGSLATIEGVPFEIIIIDNGATSPEMVAYLDGLKAQPDTTVTRIDIPFNFSKLCNAGAKLAKHPLLLFLNDDIEALDGVWLAEMRAVAAHADVGIVGARLLYADATLQHAGIASNLVPGPGHPWRGVGEGTWRTHPLLNTAGEVDAVTAACLMIRRALFDAVGGFDEEAFAITLNDVDLCLKVRARGLKIIYAPQATLLHKEGQTRRADDHSAEHVRRLGELAAYLARYPGAARTSVYYPKRLRRDMDTGEAI